MKRMGSVVHGLATLYLLAGCSTPNSLNEQQVRALRTVEVVIDVPDNNFVYYRVDTMSSMPYVAPPRGMPVGSAIAINLFAGILIGSIDHSLAQAARNDSLPVGRSVQDLDLRAMAFSQLKDMAAASPLPPSMRLSIQPFPRAEERLLVSSSHAPPNAVPNPPTAPLDPLKPMAQYAATTQADATLFVKVLPLFTIAANSSSMVLSAAWLIDRSGRLLHTTSAIFIGPPSPNVERPEAVAWWADQRYRRLVAQGVRAVLLPIGEDLTQPQLTARRRGEFEKSAAPKVQPEKLMAISQPPTMSLAQESAANAARMRSTVCIVNSDSPRVTYRYERPGRNETLVVSAFCGAETLDLLNQDLVPGVSWLSEHFSAPNVITLVR